MDTIINVMGSIAFIFLLIAAIIAVFRRKPRNQKVKVRIHIIDPEHKKLKKEKKKAERKVKKINKKFVKAVKGAKEEISVKPLFDNTKDIKFD